MHLQEHWLLNYQNSPRFRKKAELWDEHTDVQKAYVKK
jgi:hypothetical protein